MTRERIVEWAEEAVAVFATAAIGAALDVPWWSWALCAGVAVVIRVAARVVDVRGGR